jgi:hypothetical protein
MTKNSDRSRTLFFSSGCSCTGCLLLVARAPPSHGQKRPALMVTFASRKHNRHPIGVRRNANCASCRVTLNENHASHATTHPPTLGIVNSGVHASSARRFLHFNQFSFLAVELQRNFCNAIELPYLEPASRRFELSCSFR